MAVVDTVITTNLTTTSGIDLTTDLNSVTVLGSGSVVAPTEAIDGSAHLNQSVDILGYVSALSLSLGGTDRVTIGATGTFVGNDSVAGDAAITLGLNSSDSLTYGANQFLNQGTLRGTVGGLLVYGNENSIINFGTIVAVEDAIATVADLLSPTGSTVVNHGTVQSQTLAAVYLANEGDGLTNTGSLLSAKDVAVVLDGLGQHVTNEGLIRGEIGGIEVDTGAAEIWNKGDIIADGQLGLGPIAFGGFGVGFASGSYGVLTNDGTIRGSVAGVWSDFGTALIVTNTGSISGFFVGVAADSGTGVSSLITNSGTISGLEASIFLGDGDDTVINTGTLMGAVDLGAGNDVIDTRHGDILDPGVSASDAGGGTVFGGDGSDTYLIGDADIKLVEDLGVVGDVDLVKTLVSYQLETNFEDLTLLGSRSINGMGNRLNNNITGNSGDNRLYGFNGFDHMYGGLGDDVLYAGAGYADLLYGGDGEDVLIGGAGRDWMFGGADADRFVYLSASNTGPTENTSDSLSDFISGEDLVDLSRIDAILGNGAVNDAFTFIDGNAFNGVAGELRFTSSLTNTLIEWDRDGNSVADGTIRVFGTVVFTVFDFVL